MATQMISDAEGDRFIFLGIEGVLKAGASHGRHPTVLSPLPCALLDGLLQLTGAKLVFVTSWRSRYTEDQLIAILREFGVGIGRPDDAVFAGSTPSLGGDRRGEEIEAWLKGRGPVGYAILSARGRFLDHQFEHLVRPDHRDGLRLADIQAVCQHIRQPSALPSDCANPSLIRAMGRALRQRA